MDTKRQRGIRAFLIGEFGEDRGSVLFRRQTETLDALIAGETGKSKSQMKTLSRTILPSIALYKVLSGELSQERAYACVRKYMLEVAAGKHASMAKKESVPGFYALYSRIFLRIMRTADQWESTQSRGGDSFDVTITRCLWHTACAENGCAELCRLFCESDNVTYGGLRKIGFSRTKTLGCGGNCCDFHFFRKQ